jgi:predicted  nucleic acid-binding Zn-ribbon protein
VTIFVEMEYSQYIKIQYNSKENEVSVDWFFKLKEIDSLTKMKTNQLKAKQEQEARVSKLNDRRQENVLQTAKLKQDLIATNTEMAEVEKKLKNATEQKQRIIDIGGDDKKIALFTSEINQLEEKGFEFLTRLEEIETEMSDNKTFLAGIEKTIKEIEDEGREEIDKILIDITNIDLRLKLLLEELPDDFRSLLIKVTVKNLAHGPFTRIDQNACYFCRFKISRIEESEIDMQKNLKTCPQCGRIFLPYGS